MGELIQFRKIEDFFIWKHLSVLFSFHIRARVAVRCF